MTVQNILTFDPKTLRLSCQGEWNLANISRLEKEFDYISWPSSASITVDGQNLTLLDSAGAWLLSQSLKKLKDRKLKTQLENFSEPQQKLIALIEEKTVQPLTLPSRKSMSWLSKVGKLTVDQAKEFRDFLAFTGELAVIALQNIPHPKRWRLRAIASIIELCGMQALMIIALLSFMIGIVMTYQMGLQLKTYGANIYIVDLLGLSILREFAPLMTAIMIAGRTGSSFTAQLGSMQINQEIDALNAMGVKPEGLLLLPRIIGLLITLPLLTIWADIFGILGGMLMANNMLDVSNYHFLHRFQAVVSLRSLLIGLGKAPVFALIIASIGCFEGMKVRGSADSVGRQTTKSVVLSIFFIIIADALFSILFSKFKL